MARPERNTVDYYPHMCGEGKKMYFIETKYGNDGYATWHKILEKLATSEYHYLNLNKEEEIMFLASKCKISEDTLIGIITDLTKLGAVDKKMWENKIVWSQKFIDSIQDAYKKRNNKCISFEGLESLLISLGILKYSKLPTKGSVKPQSKVEYTKVEESVYRQFKHLSMSEVEFNRLVTEYSFTKQQIDKTIDKVENYRKNTSYTSLYLTTKNWLERDYPKIDQQAELSYYEQP